MAHGVPVESEESDAVRVVLVDDTPEIRFLLRLQFELDPRFLIVGEGADGFEAIRLCADAQPDILVLDRRMPGLAGIEAIPEIRRVAPATAILLYTAEADPVTRRTAIAAGALDVVGKIDGPLFIDRLVEVLVRHTAADDAQIEVRVGPVATDAARVWIDNTTTILDAVAAHPEVPDQPLGDDVLATFRSFLADWRAVAVRGGEFRWAASARADDVTRLVEQWAAIDRLTDDQLAALGVHWSPPAGEPFFAALTSGVLDALRRHDGTRQLAARLTRQWAP